MQSSSSASSAADSMPGSAADSFGVSRTPVSTVPMDGFPMASKGEQGWPPVPESEVEEVESSTDAGPPVIDVDPPAECNEKSEEEYDEDECTNC